MARTTIEGGCKAVAGNSTIDTRGYGKVTILSVTGGAITATGGETASAVSSTDIKPHIIDPDTGAVKGSPAALELVSYNGNMRYIKVTAPVDAVVILSEPRSTDARAWTPQ